MGYHLNGDNESAIPILEKTARQEPDSLFSWMFLASALAENGDLDEAREIGKKMVAIDPNLSVSTLTTMGLEYLDESIQQRIQRNFLAAGVPD
jgi:tetratricopeptide (TPR) repeat protein